MDKPRPLGPIVMANETRFWTCRCGNSSFLLRADGSCKCCGCGLLAESVRITETAVGSKVSLQVTLVRHAGERRNIIQGERIDARDLK